MAWQELFNSDIGLLSVFASGFALVLAIRVSKHAFDQTDENAHQPR